MRRAASRAARGLVPAAIAVFLAASPGNTARAAVRVDATVDIDEGVEVERVAHVPRASVDVWTNKEEGGVYRQGERMRIFFRPSADAFVLIYNIDTEGYIHLVYPYGPDDPDRVEGGRTYQVPSRGDPYDLVADGPAGVEYVVALAAPFPFRDLPWYLSGDYQGSSRDYDDYEEQGVVVGDPYVGMDRVIRRIVPRGREDDVATADTYFYIERHVDYPRYVCADCHSYGGWYDPYVDVCSVFQIRIDATWARYAPLRSRLVRPRYYYMVRSTAPTRYRQWKERWSSTDGRSLLRTRFGVDGQDRFRARREMIQRRTPPEFRNLRRPRSERLWKGSDEVIRGRERREREDAIRTPGSTPDRRDRGEVRRDEVPVRRVEEGREGTRERRGQERRDEVRERRNEGLERRNEARERRDEEAQQRREEVRERRERREPEARERRRSRDDDDRGRGQVKEKKEEPRKESGDRGDRGDRGRGRDDRDPGERDRGHRDRDR